MQIEAMDRRSGSALVGRGMPAPARQWSNPVDNDRELSGGQHEPVIGRTVAVLPERDDCGNPRQNGVGSGFNKDAPRSRRQPEAGHLNPERWPARRPSARIVAYSPERGKGYVANVLPMAKRVRAVSCLVEGNSIRATARMVDVDKDAVGRLALIVGQGCERLHNRIVRNLAAYVVQADEVWSFVAKKNARLTPDDAPEKGDVYTFIGMDANTKLVISFLAGKRDQEHADIFVKDLRSRLTVVPHMTTDGFPGYIPAIAANFKGSIDYGQCVKNYRTGSKRGPDHRYEPARDPFITKIPVFGVPRPELLSTAYVERVNLSTRHTVGRTRRLCLAYSKKLENHRAAMALGLVAYNLTRIHGSLNGRTPAMAAGLTDHVWSLEELVTAALVEPEAAAPEAQPLALVPRPGEAAQGPSRELPNGRGFLRLVGRGNAPQSPPPARAVPPPALEAIPRQLSLFDEPEGE